MRPGLWIVMLGLAGALGGADAQGVRAEPAVPADSDDACLSLNNRILGPRSGGRPFPALRGDPAHGLHTACAVSWRTLSPRNEPLAVVGCFQGSLLQVENDTACGHGTGPLWVSSRWVITSAELHDAHQRVVVCQQLETGAWAGTRDFKLECEERRKELKEPAPKAAAGPAAAARTDAARSPAAPPKAASSKAAPSSAAESSAAPPGGAPPPHPEN